MNTSECTHQARSRMRSLAIEARTSESLEFEALSVSPPEPDQVPDLETQLRPLQRTLKRLSGHLLLKKFDQVPSGVEGVRAAYEDFTQAMGHPDAEVFRHLCSLLETEDLTLIPKLQAAKIIAITKALAELTAEPHR